MIEANSQMSTCGSAVGEDLLVVHGLTVMSAGGACALVNSIDFRIAAGETVGLVGESGSGKSLTAKALVGLLPKGITASGSARFGEVDLLTCSQRKLRSLRGGGIGMLLQDPFTML